MLRRVAMNGRSRREYLEAIYTRYRQAGLLEKQVILNEFCRNTGYHRKYAIRLLNGLPPADRKRERPRRRPALRPTVLEWSPSWVPSGRRPASPVPYG